MSPLAQAVTRLQLSSRVEADLSLPINNHCTYAFIITHRPHRVPVNSGGTSSRDQRLIK